MGAGHTFRFGVQASTARTGAEWAEQARKIEGLGYSTLFMPDHFVDTDLAPMVALSFAAAATTTLRIGMLVLGNDYKHPAVVAKEAATLDVLSEGRLEFGLGAGWMTADYTALGLPYDSPGIRIARLGEALAVVKGAWGDGPFDFTGDHYTITEYDGLPKPVQQPRPPILVGGGGRKVLRMAGREADIVGINPILRAGEIGVEAARDTLGDSTRRKVEWIREGAGERFDELELQIRYFVASITDDPQALADAMAPAFGVDPERRCRRAGCWRVRSTRCATPSCSAARSGACRTSCSATTQYEEFAPVVARLAGT